MRQNPLLVFAPIVIIFLMSCVTDGPAESAAVEDPSAGAGTVEGGASAIERADREAVEDAPEAADLVGALYEDAGDSGAAIEALERQGVENMDPETRLVYAILLRNEQEYDASRDQLGIILEENPAMAEAWFNLALVEHAVQDEGARDKALDAAIDADRGYVEAYAFRGILASARSEWSAAEADFRRALELDPESVDSLAGLGWLMLRNKNLDEALSLLTRAVDLDPDNVYALVDRSRVNVALENYAAASNDLGRAIELEPDVSWHHLDRARIRFRYFNDLDGALADLTEVERLDPDNFFALVYLAGVHDQQRRFQTSMGYYRRVIEARPDYIWAYMPLGKLEWMAGDYEAAASWFAKASAEDPEEFSFAMMAGVSLLKAGRKQEASRVFSRAIRPYGPGDTVYEVIRFCADGTSDYYAINALNKETDAVLRERLWFYIGAVYDVMGNAPGARAAYERIAEKKGHMEFDMAWAALNGMGG